MKPMNYTTGEHHFRPHSVTLLPGENLLAARRRWEATRPAGVISPIFLG